MGALPLLVPRWLLSEAVWQQKEPGWELPRRTCPPAPAADGDLTRRVQSHCVHGPGEAVVDGEEGRVPWFVHRQSVLKAWFVIWVLMKAGDLPTLQHQSQRR